MVMIVAGLVTVVFHRLRQPVVLGYILAGVIIGPNTPPFPLIQDAATINILAGLGVILLMFALGLEFNLRKLRKVGASAFIAALLEILLMAWVGFEVGQFFGWGRMDSIFLGAILSISSTTIIIKALNELGKTRESFAQLIFGILIIEDILGIAMIALLSGIALTGTLSAAALASTLGRLGVFLAGGLVLGLLTVPRFIGYVAKFKSNEVLLITVLGLCFGMALLAQKLGYSVALGAFLIGAILAEAREAHRIEAIVEPVRDMFSAIFFVAIGLLIDPKVLAEHWIPVVVITAAVVVGKVVTCSFGAFAGGNDTRTAMKVGMGLAQIGEFSFIIASLGTTLHVTSDFLYPIAVAVSAVTTLLTPYLIKSADGLVSWFDRTAPPRLVSYLGLYTIWMHQWQKSSNTSKGRRYLRKWSWHIALNLLLASGIFAAASFVGREKRDLIARWLGHREGGNAVLWTGAMVLSLPLLIATYRKLQAMGVLLSEMAAERSERPAMQTAVKLIIANTVPVLGLICLGLLVLVLSAAILPTGTVFLVLLLMVAMTTVLLWRTMIRVYSKAQFALHETFAHEIEEAPAHAALPLAEMLKKAKFEVITLPVDGPSVGRFIRELALRKETGVTILAIERDGESIVSPGPDEELEAGDQIMLVGRESQIQTAKKLLLGSG